MKPVFLVWAPQYSHRSSGKRALYRLCYHLNRAGYPAAMIAPRTKPLPPWKTPFHRGSVGDAIVVYPEVVSGNPLGATKVIRWVLNDPGLIAGDRTYSANEMVFVYDPQKLGVASRAAGMALGPERVLWFGLVDPQFIYPDPDVPKTMAASFTYKGRALRDRFPLPSHEAIVAIEDVTPDMTALGDVLRRTRTLYSYDHYSNLLREAAISGVEVRTISDENPTWHDPRNCRCALNIRWHPDPVTTYASAFSDSSFVKDFVGEVGTRWKLPPPAPPAEPMSFRTFVRLRRRVRA